VRSKAIIVRHFNQARIDQHLRVTIGTDDQCQQLVAALSSFLATKK
jgi:histidinol-phosphate aminotransferase